MPRDGAGEKCKGPLPTLNMDLLEQTLAWIKWTIEQDEVGGDPQLSWSYGSWCEIDPEGDADAAHHVSLGLEVSGFILWHTNHLVLMEDCCECEEMTALCDCEEGTYWALYFANMGELGYAGYELKDATGETWYQAAAKILGLTPSEGALLFRSANTWDAVEGIARSIAAQRGLARPDPDRWNLQVVWNTVTFTEKEQSYAETGRAMFQGPEWASSFPKYD